MIPRDPASNPAARTLDALAKFEAAIDLGDNLIAKTLTEWATEPGVGGAS